MCPSEESNDPLVSVVISTYLEASQGILKCALDSLINQTYKNFECIIVGDATKDAPLIEQLLNELNDSRLRFYNLDTPGGALDVGTKPRQEGAKLAKGKYLCFLDADDEFTPKRLELMVSILENDSSLDLVFGDAEIFLESNKRGKTKTRKFIWHRTWSEKIKKRLHKKCNIFSSSEPMIRRSSYEACGGIKREGYLGDWRLWQRLISTGNGNFAHTPHVLTRYRTNKFGHLAFFWYLSKGLPFNMHRAVTLGLIPGHNKLLTLAFKGRSKTATSSR